MAAVNPTLFCWGAVEAQSDLERLRLALDYLPDRDIIEALQTQRGRGRNAFPIAAMWKPIVGWAICVRTLQRKWLIGDDVFTFPFLWQTVWMFRLRYRNAATLVAGKVSPCTQS